MYLHIGDEFIIPTASIIGIFDIDAVTVTKSGRQFLQNTEREGKLETISESLPKSFIVCFTGGEQKVYLSPISTATLNLRIRRGIESAV